MLLFLFLQQIGLLVASFLNALLSAACCTGLLLAISLTVAHNGQGLMVGCNDTEVPVNARSPVSAKCPFDSTRIYVSPTIPVPHFPFPLSLPNLLFVCNFWGTKFNKSTTEQMFNPIVLLYFTLFLPRSHHSLSLRTPPWRCGSLVLRWQHLRLDCLSGASSLGWLSEGWHPVGTATSKSRCVCVWASGYAWRVLLWCEFV